MCIKTIKKVFGVISFIREHEQRSELVEREVKNIMTLNGESNWIMIKREQNSFEDCVNECEGVFKV